MLTPLLQTFPRCSTATTTVTGSSGDWSITGASGTCSYSFTSAATGTSAEFGVGVADCSDSPGTDLQFEPAVCALQDLPFSGTS